MTESVRPGRTRLTPRHLDVLRLVAQGLTNRQIGRTLFLSEDTVKTHMRRAFEALGVNTRAQAVLKAHQLGVLEPSTSTYAGPDRRRGRDRRRDASRTRPTPSRP